jgi:YHS domain-containing protein
MGVNVDVTGVMIRGYDPVAFFTEGRAVAGRPDHSMEHEGGKYLFASAANRAAFAADPEKYAPQAGGFCAYGVAIGKKLDIDPASWSIVDGKLYFCLNPVIHESFNADTATYIRKAEENWARMRDGAPSES